MEQPIDNIVYTLEELAENSGFDKRVVRSFIEQGLLRGPDNMGRYARYSGHHLTRLLAIKELREQRGLQLSEIRRLLMTMTAEQISALAVAQRASDAASASSQISAPSSALDYIHSIRTASPPSASAPPKAPAPTPSPAQTPAPTPAPTTSPAPTTPPALPQSQPLASMVQKLDAILRQPATQPPTQRSLQGAAGTHNVVEPVVVGQPAGKAEDQPPIPSNANGVTALDQLLLQLSELTQGLRVRRQTKGESWFRVSITPDIELAVKGINEPEQLTRLERIADHLRELLLRGNHV